MKHLNTYTFEDEDIGYITGEEYVENGIRVPGPDGYSVREYYPAEIEEFCEHGHNFKSEMWFTDNLLHRTDGPALKKWYPNGSVKCIEYWQNGLMSRYDGPAAIQYFESLHPDNIKGNIHCEQWRQKDLLHRTDGPAISIFHESKQKQIAERQWWKNGQRRTEGGPAIERINQQNDIIHECHWSKDTIVIPENDYLKISYMPWKDLDHLHDKKNRNFSLRLWHQWILGLVQAPDDSEFTYPSWIEDANLDELQSRLAYFPKGMDIAKQVYYNKHLRINKMKQNEDVVREYLQFIVKQKIIPKYNSIIQEALTKEFTYVDMIPVSSVEDININDELYLEYQMYDGSKVPYILDLTFEGYTCCRNAGYWFTQKSAIDLDPWFQYKARHFNTIVGPSGIVTGKIF